MGLFSKLIRHKSKTPEAAAQEQQFDEEWVRALARFGVVTGLGDFGLKLKHPATGEVMTPHEGLGQTFSEWKAIESAYDRRALLCDQILNTVGGSMKSWQAANALVALRRPDDALAVLEQAQAPETSSAQHRAASARALLNLGRRKEALADARLAAEAEPENTRLRTLHADALHLNGQCEEAHTLYDGLMAQAESVDADSVAPKFAALFSQETGVVPSPVLALDIAEHLEDAAQAEEFWRLCETEFYDSPYFRMHHAYHLTAAGATDRGFVKLLTLVQEMPWLQEPSLNLVLYFDKLDPTGQKIMPEFQTQLRQTIQSNGWTVEGMRKITLGTDR